jgi:hypothetical protein
MEDWLWKKKRIRWHLGIWDSIWGHIDFWFRTKVTIFYFHLILVTHHMSRHGNKTHTRGYPPEPDSIGRVFRVLFGFGYGFGFSPISKHGYRTGNGYIGTHSEPIPKPVPNAENYFTLICHVILFDNWRVIKTTIDI